MNSHFRKHLPEVASEKFRNIHLKTAMFESLFDKLASLQVFSSEYYKYLRTAATVLLIINLIRIGHLPTFSSKSKR